MVHIHVLPCELDLLDMQLQPQADTADLEFRPDESAAVIRVPSVQQCLRRDRAMEDVRMDATEDTCCDILVIMSF